MAEPRYLPRWAVVALCLLAFNMTMGFAFGSFGPLLASTEQFFGVTRSAASLGIAFVNMAIGGLAPVLGNVMQRVPVRYAMAGGALLSAIAYTGLATINSYAVGMLMFCLVGTGISLTGIIGPLTVISRWFPDRRGAALSIVNLPVAMLLAPLLIGETLQYVGRSAIMYTAAAICAGLIPLFLLLRDPPQSSLAVADDEVAPTVAAEAIGVALTNRELLSLPTFWLLSLGMGIMSGTGSVFYVHVVPFGTGEGMSLAAASALVSTSAAAGTFGVLLFGRIADRIGPAQTLAIAGLLQLAVWLAMLVVPPAGLYVAAALMGLSGMAMLTLHGAALGVLIPTNSLSRGMGLSYAIKLPFLFALPPAAGFFYDTSGGYVMPFIGVAILLAVCCALFISLAIAIRSRAKPGRIVG